MILRFITNAVIISVSFFYSYSLYSKEVWILDKDISTISFELPVFLAKNINGKFNEIDGMVVVDQKNYKSKKAIFSVELKSIEMNYKKYHSLLMGEMFFNTKKFPLAILDTKNFIYNDETKIELEIYLTIKGKTKKIPLELEIINLAEELIQIKGELKLKRTNFDIGTDQWRATSILKNEAKIKTNLFLFKE